MAAKSKFYRMTLLVTTPMGKYLGCEQTEGGHVLATPTASLDNGVYDQPTWHNFRGCEHIISDLPEPELVTCRIVDKE